MSNKWNPNLGKNKRKVRKEREDQRVLEKEKFRNNNYRTKNMM